MKPNQLPVQSLEARDETGFKLDFVARHLADFAPRAREGVRFPRICHDARLDRRDHRRRH